MPLRIRRRAARNVVRSRPAQAAITLVAWLLCSVLQAQRQPELALLVHPDGRQVVCEIVMETGDSIRVARLSTGKEFTVSKQRLDSIRRGVSESEALEAIGVVELACWKIARLKETGAGNQQPLAVAVLPLVQQDGSITAEGRQLADQMISELNARGISTAAADEVAQALASRGAGNAWEPAAARELGRLVQARHVVFGTITERRANRLTAVNLIDVESGRQQLLVAHAIRMDNAPRYDASELDPVISVPNSFRTLAFSASGSLLATAGPQGAVTTWDPATGKQVSQLLGHEHPVAQVAFSPSGNLLASTSAEGMLKVWDCRRNKLFRSVVAAPSTMVRAVAFSRDGLQVATGSDDATIQIRNTGDPQAEPESLTGHLRPVRCLDFAPGGKLLASASHDSTIRLWQASPRASTVYELAAILEGHHGYVYQALFSADGRRLVSAGGDGTVRLWDVARRAPIGTLRPRAGAAVGVAYSPAGDLLASAHTNETLILWNAVTEGQLAAIVGIGGVASQLAFSPDGRTLAVACGDDTLRVWRVADLLPLRRSLAPGR